MDTAGFEADAPEPWGERDASSRAGQSGCLDLGYGEPELGNAQECYSVRGRIFKESTPESERRFEEQLMRPRLFDKTETYFARVSGGSRCSWGPFAGMMKVKQTRAELQSPMIIIPAIEVRPPGLVNVTAFAFRC